MDMDSNIEMDMLWAPARTLTPTLTHMYLVTDMSIDLDMDMAKNTNIHIAVVIVLDGNTEHIQTLTKTKCFSASFLFF